jgi:hypothetical protein
MKMHGDGTLEDVRGGIKLFSKAADLEIHSAMFTSTQLFGPFFKCFGHLFATNLSSFPIHSLE